MKIITFGFLFFICSTAFLVGKPDPQDLAVKKGFSMGSIYFEQSTLGDVRRFLGGEKVHHNKKDASESMYFLCYKNKEGQTILFGSSVMGGGKGDDSLLNQVRIPGDATFCTEKNTILSKSLDSPIKFKNGLSLGVSHDEVLKQFGKPNAKKEDDFDYIFSRELDNDCSENLFLKFSTKTEGKDKKKVITSIEVSKISGC